MILADRLYSEPLLTAVFGVFLIFSAVGLRRWGLSSIELTDQKEKIQAESIAETRLGDFPSRNWETSMLLDSKPVPVENASTSCIS
jgi:hypothetical protein